jgi:hypothetical protein
MLEVRNYFREVRRLDVCNIIMLMLDGTEVGCEEVGLVFHKPRIRSSDWIFSYNYWS